jgi:hypothetical protein
MILDFLFDDFFNEQLLKMETEAEKIVIYLTPYVLKTNLNILIYEFDKDSSVLVKEFPCHLDNKPEINLLYRKTHYDLIYSKSAFENSSRSLCLYVNLNENLKVVNTKYLEQMRKINHPGRELYILKNNSELHVDINENPFSTCLYCKNSYMHKANILGVCLNCLNNELNSQITANYIIFINEAISAYQEGNEGLIPQLFNSIFISRQIKIFDKPISLNQLAQINDKHLKNLIKDVKSNLCLMCLSTIRDNNKNPLVELPCSCLLCSKSCLKSYFELVYDKSQLERSGAFCICGYQYNSHDYKNLYEYLEVNKFKELQKTVGKFFLVSISRICIGGCMEDYRTGNRDFYTLVVRDDQITKTYKLKEFKHVICVDCFSMRKIKEKQNIECIICNRTHKVEKIKKSVSKDEDGCKIL